MWRQAAADGRVLSPSSLKRCYSSGIMNLNQRNEASVVAEKKEKKYVSDNAQLMAEWDWKNNQNFDPAQLTLGSNKKVWWKCSFCSHEWQDTINHRSHGRSCPKCSTAGTSRCEQIIYYYIQKVFPDAVNRYCKEFEFDIYIPSINTAIEYDGFFFHKANSVFERDNKKDVFCKNNKIRLFRFRSSRLKDTLHAQRITCEDYEIEMGLRIFFSMLALPCPVIDLNSDIIKIINNFRTVQQQKSLSVCYPDIAKEWHPYKNLNIPIDSVLPMSNVKFWWKCSTCGYEWTDTPNHRCGRNSGCPFCAGKVVIEGKNDLLTTHPEIAQEWNYAKNGNWVPTQVSSKSNKKAWWICISHQHEWQAAISDRTREDHQTNCPFCGNKKVLNGFNDFATTHPLLAKEWSSKNSVLPSQVTYGSHKKILWCCSICGHEWESFVYSRSKGNGCPNCARVKKP